MSKRAAILLVFVMSSGLNARQTMALIPIESEDSQVIEPLDYINPAIRVRLTGPNAFDAIESAKLQAALNKDGRQDKGSSRTCTDVSCALRIVKSIPADLVLTGRIGQSETHLTLRLFLYEVKTGHLLFADERSFKTDSIESIDAAVKDLTDRLTFRVTGVKTNSPHLTIPETNPYAIVGWGLLYPGLGHWKAGHREAALGYGTIFTLALYNAAWRTTNMKNKATRDRDGEIQNLLLSATIAGQQFPQSAQGRVIALHATLLNERYQHYRREVTGARKRVRFAYSLAAAAYLWSLADLVDYRINLFTGPEQNAGGQLGVSLTYRF
ncbi:MAG: hypothetical protein JNM27_03095 [Leptospirales bacterium]|nr:hypothetical protein [Leptospirales bacterium]